MNAEIAVIKERMRDAQRSIARLKEKGHEARPRRERYPEHCLTCCKRNLVEPGGPAHEHKLGRKTRLWIAKINLKALK